MTQLASPSDSAPGAASRAAGAVTAVIAVAAVAVPLVFDTGDFDVFARTKANALRFLAVAALAPAVYVFATRGVRGLRLHPVLDGAVAAFVVLNVAATVFSQDPQQSLVGERFQFQGLLAILIYVVFFYLARLAVVTPGQRLVVATAVCAGGIGVGLYAIVQKAGADPVWDTLIQGRVFSSIGQPNSLAAYLLLVMAVAVGLAVAGPPLAKALAGVTVAVTIPAFAWTFSRAGYAGLALAVLVLTLPLLWRCRAHWRRITAAVAIAGVVTVALLALPPLRNQVGDVWSRAASGLDLRSQDFQERYWMWEVGWAIALDRPLLGTGQETYPELFPRYRNEVLPQEGIRAFLPYRPESPHNLFIALAAGAGFPALAAFVILIGAWMWLLVDAYRQSELPAAVLPLVLVAVLAGHLLTASFMSAEITGSFLFWVLLGTGAAFALDRRPGVVARDQIPS